MKHLLIIALVLISVSTFAYGEKKMISDAGEVAKYLDRAQIYLMPQPRSISRESGKCDISKAKGIVLRARSVNNAALVSEFSENLSERCGINVPVCEKADNGFYIQLYIIDDKTDCPSVDCNQLRSKGNEAYAVSAKPDGIIAAANDETGLFYAMETITQMFAFKQKTDAIYILDWPAMKYRGMMYDISRGQMPKPETLAELIRLFARGKSNVTELYLEDMLKFEKYPDIAPDDAFTKEDYLKLSRLAKGYGMEIHPMLQVLGHMDRIASKGDYKKYMVPMPEGGSAGHLWTETIDVRKPECVQFVCDLMDEVCQAFPGKYINIDVTEIADYGFTASGTPAEELPRIMAEYINTLNKVCNKYNMSVSAAQCQLRAEGHLNGLDKSLHLLDKDIIVGSYYTAEFYGGWDYDFPKFQEQNRTFWVMPWLASHTRFMPDVTFSKDFTDITVERGMRYGAEGSISCDWGDFGHIHLPGVLIYPSMYHFAACWNGCPVDRDYFDKAFSLAVFGVRNDSPAKGIVLTGDVNQVPVERMDEAKNVFSKTNYMTGNYNLQHHFREFFDDIIDSEFMSDIVNPSSRAAEVHKRASEGFEMLEKAKADVTLNQKYYDELIWSARPYLLIGERLHLRSQYLTKAINDNDFAKELRSMADRYKGVREEYIRLYEDVCRDSAQFQGNIGWMQATIDSALERADKTENK